MSRSLRVGAVLFLVGVAFKVGFRLGAQCAERRESSRLPSADAPVQAAPVQAAPVPGAHEVEVFSNEISGVPGWRCNTCQISWDTVTYAEALQAKETHSRLTASDA